jgi:hypothetical protein
MSGPLKIPRVPEYHGTEIIHWAEVDRSFHGYLEAYFKMKHQAVKKEEYSHSFASCSKEIREWISEHSVLGNPDAETFGDAVVLPIVNHHTGKLNKYGVLSALAYLGRVSGIDKRTREQTHDVLTKLYKKNFGMDVTLEDLTTVYSLVHL